MKTIKAITDFGIKDVQTIGASKELFGELWIVANVPVKYMNAAEPLMIRKVLHYKTGGNLPIKSISHNAPAKDYLIEAGNFLSNIPVEAISKELSTLKILN
jgi:hypothetical protein